MLTCRVSMPRPRPRPVFRVLSCACSPAPVLRVVQAAAVSSCSPVANTPLWLLLLLLLYAGLSAGHSRQLPCMAGCCAVMLGRHPIITQLHVTATEIQLDVTATEIQLNVTATGCWLCVLLSSPPGSNVCSTCNPGQLACRWRHTALVSASTLCCCNSITAALLAHKALLLLP